MIKKLAAAPAGVQKAIGQKNAGAPHRRRRKSKRKRKGMTAKQAKYFGKRKKGRRKKKR